MSTNGAFKTPRAQSRLTTIYLLAYNVLSKLGWTYIIYLAVQHLLSSPAPVVNSSPSAAFSNIVQKVLSHLPPSLRKVTPLNKQVEAKIWEYIPLSLIPYVTRAKTFYWVAGPEVAFVQSFAILEVLHILLGLVRSSLVTTTMQVASRLWIVWGVVEQFPETHTNPLYMKMVVAWSLAENIRYTSYAATLMGLKLYWLQWLRYTAFYILYPLGAGSEAFLMLSTLPPLSSLGTVTWTPNEYLRGILFIVWWPSLYALMSHMSLQRSKVLGGGKGKRKAE